MFKNEIIGINKDMQMKCVDGVLNAQKKFQKVPILYDNLSLVS